MLHSTQAPASSSKYVPGSQESVGSKVGDGDGASVVGRLVGAWVEMVGTNVGLHVCVSGSASQHVVPNKLLVMIDQSKATWLESTWTSVGTLSQS